jgi:hypothetical protein
VEAGRAYCCIILIAVLNGRYNAYGPIFTLKGCSVANRLYIIICSIRAPFSVARFVISGRYYRGLFEPVIELIVR